MSFDTKKNRRKTFSVWAEQNTLFTNKRPRTRILIENSDRASRVFSLMSSQLWYFFRTEANVYYFNWSSTWCESRDRDSFLSRKSLIAAATAVCATNVDRKSLCRDAPWIRIRFSSMIISNDATAGKYTLRWVL